MNQFKDIILLKKVEEILEHKLSSKDLNDKVDFLIETMSKCPSPVTRHEAAFTLVSLYLKDLIDSNKIIKAYDKCLKNENSIVVQHEIIESLGFISSQESLKIINKYLSHENEDIRDTAILSKKRILLEIDSNNHS